MILTTMTMVLNADKHNRVEYTTGIQEVASLPLSSFRIKMAIEWRDRQKKKISISYVARNLDVARGNSGVATYGNWPAYRMTCYRRHCLHKSEIMMSQGAYWNWKDQMLQP